MSDQPPWVLGTYGPFIVERTAHDNKIGWVLTVKLEGSNEQVELRTSPKGTSGIKVRQTLWTSEADNE